MFVKCFIGNLNVRLCAVGVGWQVFDFPVMYGCKGLQGKTKGGKRRGAKPYKGGRGSTLLRGTTFDFFLGFTPLDPKTLQLKNIRKQQQILTFDI